MFTNVFVEQHIVVESSFHPRRTNSALYVAHCSQQDATRRCDYELRRGLQLTNVRECLSRFEARETAFSMLQQACGRHGGAPR